MDVYNQSRFVSRNKPYSRRNASPARQDYRRISTGEIKRLQKIYFKSRDNSFRKDGSRRFNSEDQRMPFSPVDNISANSTAKQCANEWINKTPDNNRLTSVKKRKEKTWQQVKSNDKGTASLSVEEFPVLGGNAFNSNFTPEGSKDLRNSVDEQKKKELCGQYEPPRYKRRLLLAESQQDNKVSYPGNRVTERPMMTDEHKLRQRQKQIDIGKNTVAYGRYCEAVPRLERRKEDPWTPDKYQMCSTRSWVGQIKLWRRALHSYDPPKDKCQELFPSLSERDASFEHKDWGTLVEEEEERQLSLCLSQSTDKECEAKMEVDSLETCSTQSSGMDDIFLEFDLDACLLNDGLPL